ncbi:YbhB/YbcL family Raf kinase inhibitor-like protein [Nanohaloarchaea archaeon H12]|jgi:Raf kinase inhibitor-like YbhB/YbcL family protein|nr:YbhB/YbcL family Raf kinase inhibitor-like protein [Nanohaloarchaea archaeon H12]
MQISSPDFRDKGGIPLKFGYTHENKNPRIRISEIPDDAETLALLVEDPDAVEPAGKIWLHWLTWNIEPGKNMIETGESPGKEANNDFGEKGYGGPNPPDGRHRYIFRAYALDSEIKGNRDLSREEFKQRIEDHTLDKDSCTGYYPPE